MITPFFKVLAISPREIKVVYSNGVKARYKKSQDLKLWDEHCYELNQHVSFKCHYRAYIENGVVRCLQRNRNISEGSASWNCR